MTAPLPGAGARRRSPAASGRLHPLVILSVLVPVLAVAVAWGLRQPTATRSETPPDPAPLTRADRGCPASLAGPGRLLVSDARGEVGGEVGLRDVADEAAESEPLTVPAGAVAEVGAAAPTLVTARADLAPGLLATRVASGPLAATACPAPAPETWFTGLGARAEHASTLELQNPDVGAAIVDVTVYTRQGIAEVPELRGIRVPGQSAYVVDLARTAPRRGDLSVRLSVTRGRLSASVSDRFSRIGADLASADWLAPQPAPAASTLLLGLPEGRGSRTLTLTNPGADQARVTVKVVAPESTFAPTELSEVRVRPGSLVAVRMGPILAREVRRGAVGVLVEATVPVVSSLVSLVEGDLAVATPAPETAAGTALLPAGSSFDEATVLVANAAAAGLAVLRFRSADGSTLPPARIEVAPGRAYAVPVPRGAVVARLTAERTKVSASVLVAGDGSVVLPLVAPDEVALVPGVRPADR